MKSPVVLISGATSVLGTEIVRVLTQHGFSLALLFHNNEEKKQALDQALDALSPQGSRIWRQGDLLDRKWIPAFVDEVVEKLGPLTGMIHAAGISLGKPLITMHNEEWDQVLGVHLHADAALCREVLRVMIKDKQPAAPRHLVHLSSLQAIQGGAFLGAYAAAKAGIIGLSKSLAKEYGRYAICSNVIFPGYFDSPMTQKNSSEFEKSILEENVLKRKNDPAEVAQFVFELLQKKNISGQVFNLDSRTISL
jgi:3-oxoacyl-[acyl-carrier protein] reductase